jgi:hypothetical protein
VHSDFSNALYKTKIVPVALYGSLAYRVEHGLRVFVNRVLRKMSRFVGKTNKHGDRENGTIRNKSICNAHQTCRWSN